MTEPSQKHNRAALILVSDTHENHIFGLGPPVFTRSDGDVIKANNIRRELWSAWNRFFDQAFKLSGGYYRVVCGLGDLIESDAKVRSQNELVTRSPPDALRMVCETWEPIAQEADNLLIIRGTPAHTGEGSWQEESVAQNFDNTIPDTENSNASWWHFYGEFGGVIFDLAHHSSMGRISRNLAGAAGRLAYDVQRAYIMDWKLKPPDLVIRAHNHRFADSGTTYDTRALMIGCFQYKTAYLHRINAGYEMPQIGGLVVLCDGGRYELHPIRIRPKSKRLWKITK